MINEFEIRCTPEQSQNALKLGAPIEQVTGRMEDRPCFFTKEYYEEGYQDCSPYYIPTAEEMIGWLESQDCIRDVEVVRYSTWRYRVDITNLQSLNNWGFTSRKEATLAAIDAALDYLLNKNKYETKIKRRKKR